MRAYKTACTELIHDRVKDKEEGSSLKGVIEKRERRIKNMKHPSQITRLSQSKQRNKQYHTYGSLISLQVQAAASRWNQMQKESAETPNNFLVQGNNAQELEPIKTSL